MPLQYDNVSFGYRRNQPVIQNLSYAVRGGVTVILGPNGAGKSTMLGLASSALAPWSGRVRVGRLDSVARGDRRSYRGMIGWLPQQVQIIPAFSAREQVAYVGWLKGLGRREAWDQAATALDRVKLLDRASMRVGRLSGGQLRRVGVAQTLVHHARLILMDEPTAGLDPAQRANFRDLIAEISESVDIVISTHQTEDLRSIAQNVTVIADGKLRWDGVAADFLAQGPPGVPDTTRAEVVYSKLLG